MPAPTKVVFSRAKQLATGVNVNLTSFECRINSSPNALLLKDHVCTFSARVSVEEVVIGMVPKKINLVKSPGKSRPAIISRGNLKFHFF